MKALKTGSMLLPFLASWAVPALAAPSVSLSYEAPGGAAAPRSCPSQGQFLAALRSRGVDLESAEAAGRARSVDVRIRDVGGSYVGELVVQSREAGAASRTVHDADCNQVASGLALTAAIALGGNGDAQAADVAVWQDDMTPARSSTEPQPEASAVGETPGKAPPAPVAEPTPSTAPSRLRGNSFAREDRVQVEAGTLELDGARAYTLTAGAHSGLIPGQLMPRYDLTASVVGFFTPPKGESRLFGPVLQVHWAALGPVTTRHAGSVALETWGLEAGLNSCSAFTYDTEGWVALACAEFGLGWLFMDATAPGAPASTQSRGYGFGGLALDTQYNLGPLVHIGLRVGGRLNTPVRADGPDGSQLFESSPWGAYATFGFGIHF